MTAPLAIDLFCGLGGWTEGLLAEGYRVAGFDNERHVYGEERYPAQLVIQDVLTIHGSQFKDAALIVASPPCQAYSYRAMPWKRAKALPPPDNALFEACFRIQAEAIEAAGHFIPLVVENVRGAQPYVGRSKYHFGSFHLWGDVPALMPPVGHRSQNAGAKVPNMMSWDNYGKPGYKAQAFNGTADKRLRDSEGVKVSGLANGRFPPGCLAQGALDREETGRKVTGDWFGSYADMKAKGMISPGRLHGKGSKGPQACERDDREDPAGAESAYCRGLVAYWSLSSLARMRKDRSSRRSVAVSFHDASPGATSSVLGAPQAHAERFPEGPVATQRPQRVQRRRRPLPSAVRLMPPSRRG